MVQWDQLITGCKLQHRPSQEALYAACYTDMIKVCLRYARDWDEAGALYNEAMLKVFNGLHQYEGKGEPGAWIRRIVVNTCIDHSRKKARFTHSNIEEMADQVPFIVPDIYDRLSAQDVLQLLHELPPNTALVFTLFVLEGYKHEEIARLLDIATGTSKWHLNEARRLLKHKLELLLKKETYYNAI